MQLTGNTIFITGGTSGIGRGLAEAFHQRGNQVIISGRRQGRLDEICRAYPGMRSLRLDVTDPEAIRNVAHQVITGFPSLNCVLNNAGVQTPVDFAVEITTNLLGPIRLAEAFLPHLATRPGATLINVSSGLAFVPIARFAVYCATKAAIHSWTLSLRHQLRNTAVKVIELIPPYVDTELGGPDKHAQAMAGGPSPMPLDAFVAETMRQLEFDTDELPIGEARRLVATACADSVRKVFTGMNSR